jgi:SAM-dependent methyltransferase
VDDSLARDYDEVPYTSFPDPARHPERLAAIGTLLGLDVAPLATCRVLEFACGDGSNLLPAAALLPNATFVGFDFSAHAIARAARMADELRLANVRLLQRDLRALPDEIGRFDYVIAHGLYSWIPDDVRAHVMPLIARHLAPNGIAFVSYNVLPGSHLRAIAWDMMKHHTRHIANKAAKVAAARTLLDLVALPVDGDTPTDAALRAEVRNAANGSDASLAHDDLSEPNVPVHFHAFVADTQRAGLAYLADARFGTMGGAGLAPRVLESLESLDRLEREQYLDFVRFRHFRQSLLCHAGALASFDVQPARARRLHAVPTLDLRRAASDRHVMSSANADAEAVQALLLARWPRSIEVAAIAEQIAQTCGSGLRLPAEDVVVDLYAEGLVDLRTVPLAVSATAGARPVAFPVARAMTREREVIPSLYHEALRYADPVGRRLLERLDGTRTREELAAAVGGPFTQQGGAARLDRALAILASKALLVA